MINLDNWGDDFERGDVSEYHVEAMDVGEVLMIHLHNNGGGWWYKNPDWFVNRISVISSSQQNPFEFPCYRWVLSDLVVFEGKGNKTLLLSLLLIFIIISGNVRLETQSRITTVLDVLYVKHLIGLKI